DQARPVEIVVREEPRRAGEQVDARGVGDHVGELGLAGDRCAPVLGLGVLRARLLEAAEAERFFAGGVRDLVEQIVDRLVASRGGAGRASLVACGFGGMSALGSGIDARLGPRRRTSTPAASSTSWIVPAGFPVAGSIGTSPGDSLCCWGGKLKR